jgi:hypothetical protein
MRFVRFFLIGVIVLFVVSTALSLLFPGNVRISRTVEVDVPREKAYATLSDLRTWERWNGFIRGTPLTGKAFSSPASGKGAQLRSDQLVITEGLSDSNYLSFDWNLVKGRRFQGGFSLLQIHPERLTVQYWFEFHLRWYPWERLGIFVYDRQWGPMLKESLDSLKLYLENSP